MSTSISTITASPTGASSQSLLLASFNCQVCESDAHGTHFGARTCRACASFFRRTISMNLRFHCRFRNDCVVSLNNRYSCRCCRLKKCFTVGMIPDNIQWDRDATSSTVHRKRASEDDEQSPVPPKILLPGWRIAERTPPVFDLTNLFRRIRRTFSKFKQPRDPFYIQSNTLTRMDWVLRNFRKHTGGKQDLIKIRTEFSVEEIISDRGGLVKLAAEWMMHSEEFRGLTSPEKFQVFMETWQVWDRLCKIQHGCEVFGRRVLEEKLQMMSPNEACPMDSVCIDYSSISNRPSKEVKQMLFPIVNRMFEEVVRPLLDLQPSSIETTYLLCNITFTIAHKKLPEAIAAAADKFLNRVANDLHEYYGQKRITQYAARLLKLMGIVNSLQRLYKERKKLLELAKLFDVINSNVCEPNLFE